MTNDSFTPQSTGTNPAGIPVYTFGGLEFVRVSKGKFIMGSDVREQEKPQHAVDIPYDYWMARFPVTNEQYAMYIGKGEHPVNYWQQKKEHPLDIISWDEAISYCKWLNNLLYGELPNGYLLRLPTEAEWEKAARGNDAREWPWGNEFDKNKCNSADGKKNETTPIGFYSPQGDSPYGCADMVGNVSEWTHSLYKPYPYQSDDDHESETAPGYRVLRGGSWNDYRSIASCTFRLNYHYSDISDVPFGFRVCASPISFNSVL